MSGSYAVTALFPSVFVDGFFANGIAAIFGPVDGLPGSVYQIGAYVPGTSERVDKSIKLREPLMSFLRQNRKEKSSFDESFGKLKELARLVGVTAS